MGSHTQTTDSSRTLLNFWKTRKQRKCKSLSRPSQGKQSPSRLSPLILLRMSKLRFRTKKEFPQTNRDLSLLVSSWRMEELFLITTFRRRAPFISFSVSEVACRSLSRPSPAKPSLWRWNHLIPLKMLRQRSRTRKEFPQTSRGLYLLVSSWRMEELSLTTTSRRRAPFISFFVSEEETKSVAHSLHTSMWIWLIWWFLHF